MRPLPNDALVAHACTAENAKTLALVLIVLVLKITLVLAVNMNSMHVKLVYVKMEPHVSIMVKGILASALQVSKERTATKI